MRGGFQVFVSGVALVAVTLAGASTAAAQEPAAAPQPAKPVLALDEGDVALITMLIKPDKTADFELVLNKLKEALAKSEKPERKQQAAGWKIFKSHAAWRRATPSTSCASTRSSRARSTTSAGSSPRCSRSKCRRSSRSTRMRSPGRAITESEAAHGCSMQ